MENKVANWLGGEKSPYLLQHRYNPVAWYPWSKEAFEVAREEGKPIFLSIGYSTCYWCHVMEKECFEDEEVARVLNQHFISVKVDREERPDVDKIYMDAVVGLTGHGGWPMSVFLTPELQPFYGGTYFPKDNFMLLLGQLQQAWSSKKEEILSSAESITNFLKQRRLEAVDIELDETVLRKTFAELKSSFDQTYGSFGGAPKFPPSVRLALLLRIYRRSGQAEALSMVEQTLEQMARGGIYDQLGGGFHRYSTDTKWLVPHFEKMLYDNALLAWVYLEAFQVTKKEMYREVARETLDYVLREMTDQNGGFYSAQDAGEVGKEGEYYVWKSDEINNLLSADEAAKINEIYGVSSYGNFEHETNIFNLQKSFEWSEKNSELVRKASEKLVEVREKRNPPHKDDKTLTAWNGLMIFAFSLGYQVIGESRYLEAARKSASFIKSNLWDGKTLKRRYRDGEAKFEAYLDDYAFLIHGLIGLYQSDFDSSWLKWALDLQAKQDQLFWDEQGYGYFFSRASDPSLIVRSKELNDGALPAGNGVSAQNLIRLYHFTFDKKLKERFEKLLSSLGQGLERFPSAFASSAIALDYYLDSAKEIVLVGNQQSKLATDLRSFIFQTFLPNKIYAEGTPAELEDKTSVPIFRGKQILSESATIYICENGTCKEPTSNLEAAQKQIKQFKEYSINK